jgi:hypothetical protein
VNEMIAERFDFNEEPSSPNRWATWVKTIACWDGALPLAIGSTAPMMNAIFPRHSAVGTIVAVFLPIAGFFIRLGLGNHHFQTHRHFIWQRALFVVAIFWLILLDATLIMFRLVPQGIGRGDWNAWLMMYFGYLTGMAAALFPRGDPSPRAAVAIYLEDSLQRSDRY